MPTQTLPGYTYNETIDVADDAAYKIFNNLPLTDFEEECADYHSLHVEDKLEELEEAAYEKAAEAAAQAAYEEEIILT